jgi:antitoxin component of MazEF toxin-antitoxin module
MTQLPVISYGDSSAVVLPAALLESLGLRVGDVVDVTVSDRQLILSPAEDNARRQLVESITREMFERRQDAYQRLA